MGRSPLEGIIMGTLQQMLDSGFYQVETGVAPSGIHWATLAKLSGTTWGYITQGQGMDADSAMQDLADMVETSGFAAQMQYLGQRFKIINTTRAQGHCYAEILGKEMVCIGAYVYPHGGAWVWGYIPGEISQFGGRVEVGLLSNHLERVEVS